ncbi:CDP-alcohol phosphatidyltransferase family protein [Propionivibrio sp.]|uniref:CDP-alcohol phosphatidyltransferase family protein n=1 Tax=Propionivibrio sp. TaxID=2212460 RepID=UPI0026327B73|nr:CDP-alcohol phosphatidyltransferase family protein [Propionivibrio sp.]
MKQIIDRIFSERYVNHGAVVGNVVLLLMYRFAYPFAVLLNTLRLSPNQITSCSLMFSIAAFLSLVFDEGWRLFAIFWSGSVLFDFCDGTVARMTNKVSKSAFRYDHMSDIFKINLAVFGVGLRNDVTLYWVLCCIFIFCYTYSELVDHDLNTALARTGNKIPSGRPEIQPLRQGQTQEKSGLVSLLKINFPFTIQILSNVYAMIIGFNGHTLLVFFTFPFGGWVTTTALLYLIFITIFYASRCINTLRHMSR